MFQLHCFWTPFLQLAAEKKDSKNGAARKVFGQSYFDPTIDILCKATKTIMKYNLDKQVN